MVFKNKKTCKKTRSCVDNQDQFCYEIRNIGRILLKKNNHLILYALFVMQYCTNAKIVETMETLSLLYQQFDKNRKMKGIITSA